MYKIFQFKDVSNDHCDTSEKTIPTSTKRMLMYIIIIIIIIMIMIMFSTSRIRNL